MLGANSIKFRLTSLSSCGVLKAMVAISVAILVYYFVIFGKSYHKLRSKPLSKHHIFKTKTKHSLGIDFDKLIKKWKHEGKFIVVSDHIHARRRFKNHFENFTFNSHSSLLFSPFKEENYSKQQDNYLKPKDIVDNKLNHSLIIPGKNICQKHNLYLLIIFPSVLSDRSLRTVIRRTWLEAVYNNKWPKQNISQNISHLFFVSRPRVPNKAQYEALFRESNVFGDIVLSDFVDSYKNLSRKMITSLQWVHKYCSHAKFILKCDQDTFVNVPLMINYLSLVEELSPIKKFIIGRKVQKMKPKVQRTGKWAVSSEDYPLKHYPQYVFGHTYVISQDAVSALLSVANRVRLIGPEDVFITGILPKASGVTRFTSNSFAVCCRNVFDCEIVWNTHVSMTTLQLPEDHVRLWSSIKKEICHPLELFNKRQRPKKHGVFKHKRGQIKFMRNA